MTEGLLKAVAEAVRQVPALAVLAALVWWDGQSDERVTHTLVGMSEASMEVTRQTAEVLGENNEILRQATRAMNKLANCLDVARAEDARDPG